MGILEIRRKETPTMTQKRPENPFFLNKASSSSLTSSQFSIPRGIPPPSPLHKFSESTMEENIKSAEAVITKWDPNSSSYTKFASLFQENREEAKDFVKCVKDLRLAMHFLVADYSGSAKLVLAQKLMQIAMKRLEKEFYQILSANRQYLNPESVSSCSSCKLARSSASDDEDHVGTEEAQMAEESNSEAERLSEIAMSDLKLIADRMISSGYGTECVKIYKIIRKSIVDEELYHLRIERYSSSMINKMNPEVLEHHIKNWLNVIKIVTKTLFPGERLLCDHVFSVSDTIRGSCFADVTNEKALNFFRFPELVAKSKRSLEKIFRTMDLYESISDLWPEIESIFSCESTSVVKLQALHSLLKLGDSVRKMLSEFETSIQKNSSKALVPGGGIHPLTNSVMNYVASLANYSGVLTDVLTDSTSSTSTETLLPESYFEIPSSDGNNPTPAISIRLARIILVLLCKLDSKAELYKDIALSYLFLVNNLQFVIEKVRSTNLKCVLGVDWVAKHEKKVKQYAASYEALAWAKVFSALPENSSDATSPETVEGCVRQFASAFDEAYKKQAPWVVPDGKLRDEIKVSIAKKLVPAYREFYDRHLETLGEEKNLELAVRFAPDNLGNYLSDLFHGTAISGSSSSSSSSLSSSSSSHSRVYRCLP